MSFQTLLMGHHRRNRRIKMNENILNKQVKSTQQVHIDVELNSN